jgi:hypothetical protein
MPPNIIKKINKFGESSKSLTLSTVKAFYEDAANAKFKIKK